jgi:peptidoglycan/xylan/chitin deacetylase (PgdA/CDA1 family)
MPHKLGKRELAARIAGWLRLPFLLGSLRSAMVRDVRVLAYHRVLPELDEARYKFDVHLVSAVREEFDWQMAYVARRFRPVTCKQVVDAINGGPPLPRRAVMVTFDDGFDDNCTVAFPILRRHGVPALFFLATGYIGTQRVFWFDWLVHVLLATAVPEIRLEALDVTLNLAGSSDSRRDEAFKLLRLLKRVPDAQRLEVLEDLRHLARVELSAADAALSAPMTWAQVREMSQGGMEFGSHTVSHPILSRVIDDAQLQHELTDSKRAIEAVTELPVTALAYPVGGSGAVSDKVVNATASAGYGFAFTYETGTGDLSAMRKYLMKRLPVERYTTRAMFVARLELPEIF